MKTPPLNSSPFWWQQLARHDNVYQHIVKRIFKPKSCLTVPERWLLCKYMVIGDSTIYCELEKRNEPMYRNLEFALHRNLPLNEWLITAMESVLGGKDAVFTYWAGQLLCTKKIGKFEVIFYDF